jgi:hypothetical protein
MEWLVFLGGAAVAALINVGFGTWKHISDHRAQTARWRRERAEEHQRWLRDKKLEAYVDFFEATRLVLNLTLLHGRAERRPATHEELDDAQSKLKGSPIRLLGPEPIRLLAAQIRDQVDEHVDAATDQELSYHARRTKLDELKTRMEGDRVALAELCRGDLERPSAN